MTAATWLLLMVSCVLSALSGTTRAQDAAREPVLALSVGPELVPAVALAGALEAELGVAVNVVAEPDFAIPTVTVAKLASGNVEVALASRSIPRASRQLVLSAELERERVETLALIAANLVRNEAAALLPDLRPAAVSSVDPATPAPAPTPTPKPASVNPCDLKERGGFGFDFAPGVGSSSSPEGRVATRRVSLGIIGTLHGAQHGVGLSIGVNIARKTVCGAQLALANVALGSMQGAQLGEFNLVRGDVHGTQLGLLNLTTGDFRGLQAGLANGAGGHVHGAQLGLVNHTGGSARGLAAGVLNLGMSHYAGAQLGVANVAAGGVYGAQLGVANLSVGDAHGAQVGVANLTVGETAGTQIGTANVSTGAVDVQVGVFNYADRSKASIGVLSIVRRGRTSLDLTGAVESGLLMASVTHGGKYVHNVLGVGLRTDKQGERVAMQLGLGVRVLNMARVSVDIDALTTSVIRDGEGRDSSFIAGGRVPVTITVARGFGVLIAPSYQVMVTDDAEEDPDPVFGRKVFERGSQPDDTRVIGYPGLTLGLRYQFDHGA